MRKWQGVVIGLTGLVVWFGVSEYHTISTKNKATEYAQSIPGTILNVGAAGVNQWLSPPDVGTTKCDIVPSNNIEKCDISGRMPYNDKQFDVVFASHVIEHVKPSMVVNSLNEFNRIGKCVILVLSNSWHIPTYIASGHLSIISKVGNNLLIKNNAIYNNISERYIYILPDSFEVFI